MAPRSNWKGYLKLSLVIGFHSHLPRHLLLREGPLQHPEPRHRQPPQAADGGFRHRRCGRQRGAGEGLRRRQGPVRDVEDEELAEVAIESSHTVDIEKFVPKASIDDRYRDTPYYLAPEDKVGQEAFAVIRDAMRKKKMVGIARVVMARRERVMMLEPFGKGIMGTTLLYPYEIRSEEGVFEEIPELKLPEQMVGLAEDHHRQDDRQFEPDKFEDRYENAMIELIRSKQAGLPAPKEKAPSRPANVVNLMDALRRSIETTTSAPEKKAPAKKAEAAPRKKKAARG